MKRGFDNKKLNNKGIAISGVMYMILLVSLLLVVGTLKTLQNRKIITDKLKSDTIEELTKANVVESSILKVAVGYTETSPFLEGGVARSKYESVKVVTSNEVPSNAIASWDVSQEQNGGIMAWYLDADNNGMYELYIGQKRGVIASPNSSYLFQSFTNTKSMDLANLKTANVTNMDGMFSGTSSLTSLDLSNFDTSNVTNMEGMFFGASSLTSLDVSSFDTSNVTTMKTMFYNVSNLTNLDVSNFDTSNVTDMDGMFMGTNGLTSLDLSNFDTSKVTIMKNMFYDAKSLINLDVSNFDTSSVTDMEGMFHGVRSLTSLDVSNFNTSNVTNMSYMFKSTNKLETLKLNKATFDNVTTYTDMFVDSIVSTIYVKDTSAQTFINNRLSDAELSANVILAS